MTIARKITKRNSVQSNRYKLLAIKYSPIWVPILIVILFVVFVLWPLASKLSALKIDIEIMQDRVVTVNRGIANLEKNKKDLAAFRKKVKEFEKRLPERLKTTLIIETLEEITKKSKLKFSSLKPLPAVDHTLKDSSDIFVELPVQVKLLCGYYDLIEFIKKIEDANQLMKISNLVIKGNAKNLWEHNIEFSISAFSRKGKDESNE